MKQVRTDIDGTDGTGTNGIINEINWHYPDIYSKEKSYIILDMFAVRASNRLKIYFDSDLDKWVILEEHEIDDPNSKDWEYEWKNYGEMK